MRLLVGIGISKKTKSKIISDTEINYKGSVLLEFPVPAKKIRVSLVKDAKQDVLVLLLE